MLSRARRCWPQEQTKRIDMRLRSAWSAQTLQEIDHGLTVGLGQRLEARCRALCLAAVLSNGLLKGGGAAIVQVGAGIRHAPERRRSPFIGPRAGSRASGRNVGLDAVVAAEAFELLAHAV